MIHRFSFTIHTKVAKIVLSGEPRHSKPFGILLKGFFLIRINSKKEFLNQFVVSREQFIEVY